MIQTRNEIQGELKRELDYCDTDFLFLFLFFISILLFYYFFCFYIDTDFMHSFFQGGTPLLMLAEHKSINFMLRKLNQKRQELPNMLVKKTPYLLFCTLTQRRRVQDKLIMESEGTSRTIHLIVKGFSN